MKGRVGACAIALAVIALGVGALSSSASAEDIGKTTGSQLSPSRIVSARLYCTPDHESHFGELTAELAEQNFAPPAAPIYIGGNQPASNVFFAGFEAHWGADDLANHLYHPTPAVQLLTVAEGVFSITTSDGRSRQLHAGDLVHLEDVAPCKGHITVGDNNGVPCFRSLTLLPGSGETTSRRRSLRAEGAENEGRTFARLWQTSLSGGRAHP